MRHKILRFAQDDKNVNCTFDDTNASFAIFYHYDVKQKWYIIVETLSPLCQMRLYIISKINPKFITGFGLFFTPEAAYIAVKAQVSVVFITDIV
jgi:hypothetical protein